MKFLMTMTDIAGQWDNLSNAARQQVLEQHREFQQALEDAVAWAKKAGSCREPTR